MENFTKTADRIKEFIDYKKVSVNKFSKTVGASNSYFNKLFKNKSSIGSDRLTRILNEYQDLNSEWLLTGEGEMLKAYTSADNVLSLNDPQSDYNSYPLFKMSHLLECDSDFSLNSEGIDEHYKVPKFRNQKVDFIVESVDNSMYPKYKSGDILACKKITSSNFIQWNEVHIVITKEQGILVKRLTESESKDSYIAISENEKHTPFEIPKSEVVALALVIGSICLE